MKGEQGIDVDKATWHAIAETAKGCILVAAIIGIEGVECDKEYITNPEKLDELVKNSGILIVVGSLYPHSVTEKDFLKFKDDLTTDREFLESTVVDYNTSWYMLMSVPVDIGLTAMENPEEANIANIVMKHADPKLNVVINVMYELRTRLSNLSMDKEGIEV
jgi:hypothetical protein